MARSSNAMASAGARGVPETNQERSLTLDGGRPGVPRLADDSGNGHDSRPLPPAITACVVIDDEERRWTRLPQAWRERAGLCQAWRTYDASGRTYLVRCARGVAWAAGPLGLCGTHFAALLECGA